MKAKVSLTLDDALIEFVDSQSARGDSLAESGGGAATIP